MPLSARDIVDLLVPPPSGLQRRNGSPGTLQAATNLIAAMHQERLLYCHWKSVWAIERSLSGEADFDLLFDRRQSRYAQEVLARCGFKRFLATESTGYAAVEDYVGLDADAGRLLHCHVHYRLILGEPNLKSFRLPWEKLILRTRRRDPATGVYVTDLNLEMLLLCIRFAVKLRWRDIAAELLDGRWLKNWDPEFRWIRSRTDADVCVRLCRELLDEPSADALRELLLHPLSLENLIRFRRSALRRIELFRRYGFVTRCLLRWRREFASVRGAIGQRLLSASHPQRRTVPTGGILIAFLGPDGSGKSTITRDTATVLAGKLDVLLLYFGSGSGPSSWLRWPLNVLRAATARLGVLPTGQGLPRGNGSDRSGKRRGALFSLALIVWALVLAREKRRKLLAAWKARDAGIIVLADRYPQTQVAGFNDGPLLGHLRNHRNRLLRWCARHEAIPYRWAEEYPPDVVVKLQVSAETALHRKPDMRLHDVLRRINAVRDLSYAAPVSVVEIDANQPLTRVRSDVFRAVWNHI